MARMHIRRKGKSCSKHPLVTENPEWVPLSATEIEDLIVKMAKDGITSAKIGLNLRDQYGVPNVKLATGKTVTDPTSGLRMAGRNVIRLFANCYPKDYPEPESTVAALNHGYKIEDIKIGYIPGDITKLTDIESAELKRINHAMDRIQFNGYQLKDLMIKYGVKKLWSS